jgi:hypothetical protein
METGAATHASLPTSDMAIRPQPRPTINVSNRERIAVQLPQPTAVTPRSAGRNNREPITAAQGAGGGRPSRPGPAQARDRTQAVYKRAMVADGIAAVVYGASTASSLKQDPEILGTLAGAMIAYGIAEVGLVLKYLRHGYSAPTGKSAYSQAMMEVIGGLTTVIAGAGVVQNHRGRAHVPWGVFMVALGVVKTAIGASLQRHVAHTSPRRPVPPVQRGRLAEVLMVRDGLAMAANGAAMFSLNDVSTDRQLGGALLVYGTAAALGGAVLMARNYCRAAPVPAATELRTMRPRAAGAV